MRQAPIEERRSNGAYLLPQLCFGGHVMAPRALGWMKRDGFQFQ